MKHSSKISVWLGKIPRIGSFAVSVYEWKPQYWNFALVGAVGVFWQYLFTWLFIAIGFPWWFAMAIGIFIAFNSNFILNKNWVFKGGEKQRRAKENAKLEQGSMVANST